MTNKHNYNVNLAGDATEAFESIIIGKVVSTTDEYDGNRIKVRLKGIDDKVTDNDLPFAFPLLPKFVNVMPSEGESVFIFMMRSDNKVENRLWLGPIISQPQKLSNDPHFYSSTSLLDTGMVGPEKSPTSNPNAKGVYPDKKYISIQGRDNADIVFKKSELLLRAGKYEENNNLKFNKRSVGFIQIKDNLVTDKKNNTKGSVTNIVSDKINLLTHKGNPRYTLNDQTSMIKDDEIANILETAHPAVYGDNLLELLKILIKAIINHSHPYAGMKPVEDDVIQNVNKYNLETILSNNIRMA